MKNGLLLELFKKKTLSIPLFLYQVRSKMKIEGEEFIFFMYLYNQGEKFLFDPNTISKDLGIDLGTIMGYISSLTEKDLISVDVEKNDKNIREEYVSLDSFYKKLSIWLMDNDDSKEDNDSDVFSFIEKEFGRTISPSEYQVIKAWISDDNSEDLIKEAVSEAVLNGVSSIRYIDKILYEWKKKNIKTKEDVEKQRERFRNKKEEPQVEVFEYDWLDDDED